MPGPKVVNGRGLVAVCGEALIDLVPAPGGGTRSTPGGGPFTTARALARLGVPTAFLGRLSTDALGRGLADLLRADGVDLSLTSFGPEPTTLAHVELGADGRAAYRFQFEGTSAPNLTGAMLPARLGPDVRAIVVGSLGLWLEPIASTLFDLVIREGEGRLCLLDPNIRPALLRDAGASRTRLDAAVARSTIVKASDDDLAWLFPGLGPAAAAEALLRLGPRLVVVTLGAAGAMGISPGAQARVGAPAVEVVDTIGAGDAFGAALLAFLYEHRALRPDLDLDESALRSALEFSCLVASLTCTRSGAEPPWRSEVEKASPRMFG